MLVVSPYPFFWIFSYLVSVSYPCPTPESMQHSLQSLIVAKQAIAKTKPVIFNQDLMMLEKLIGTTEIIIITTTTWFLFYPFLYFLFPLWQTTENNFRIPSLLLSLNVSWTKHNHGIKGNSTTDAIRHT